MYTKQDSTENLTQCTRLSQEPSQRIKRKRKRLILLPTFVKPAKQSSRILAQHRKAGKRTKSIIECPWLCFKKMPSVLSLSLFFFFLLHLYYCPSNLRFSTLTHPYRLVMQSEHGFKFCKLDVAAFKIPVHQLTIKICCLRHRKSEQYTRSNVLSSNRNRLIYKPLLTEQGPLVFL